MTPPPRFLPVDAAEFRRVMGLFATGVTVVVAQAGDEIRGMTANAVTAVSLSPLLTLVCVGRQARITPLLREAGKFSINILTEEHEVLSRYFAGTWDRPAPPAHRFLPWEGGARLAGTIAAIACAVDRWIEAGVHWIVLGRVTAMHLEDPSARPLVFYGGRYRKLSPEAVSLPEQWGPGESRVKGD